MTPTPPLDLDAIEARANAATKGPWGIDYAEDECEASIRGAVKDRNGVTTSLEVATLWRNHNHESLGKDGDFITAAREDVPALCAALRSALARAEILEQRNVDLNALLVCYRLHKRAPEALLDRIMSNPIEATDWRSRAEAAEAVCDALADLRSTLKRVGSVGSDSAPVSAGLAAQKRLDECMSIWLAARKGAGT